MKISAIAFVSILLLHFSDYFSDAFSLQLHTIAINGFEECEEDNTFVHFNGTITKSIRNKYAVNGELKFFGNFTAPLEVIELSSIIYSQHSLWKIHLF